jgi:hypothetical protein
MGDVAQNDMIMCRTSPVSKAFALLMAAEEPPVSLAALLVCMLESKWIVYEIEAAPDV